MYIDKFDKEQVKNIKYAYKFMRTCIENRIDSLSYLDVCYYFQHTQTGLHLRGAHPLNKLGSLPQF